MWIIYIPYSTTIRHTETLVYYDGILSFVATGNKGSKFICTLVEEDTYTFFCVSITDDRLLKAWRHEVDLRDIYMEPDGEMWYTVVPDENPDMRLVGINRSNIPEWWFVGEGVWLSGAGYTSSRTLPPTTRR